MRTKHGGPLPMKHRMTRRIALRRLTSADAAEYRAVRLRMLKDHPEAFLVSHAEGKRDSVAVYGRRLAASPVLGAFVDGKLAATVGYFRETARKARHKVTVWGVYVAPEHRGLRLGRTLMLEALRRLRRTPGVEQVRLDVGTRNRPARALYRSVGFRRLGIERRAMKVGGRAVDEELMVLFLRSSSV